MQTLTPHNYRGQDFDGTSTWNSIGVDVLTFHVVHGDPGSHRWKRDFAQYIHALSTQHTFTTVVACSRSCSIDAFEPIEATHSYACQLWMADIISSSRTVTDPSAVIHGERYIPVFLGCHLKPGLTGRVVRRRCNRTPWCVIVELGETGL